MANKRPSLHFYGMIILVKKGSLQKNGMAAIQKIFDLVLFLVLSCGNKLRYLLFDIDYKINLIKIILQ